MLGNVEKAWAKILCLDLAPIGKIDFNRGKEKIVIQPKIIAEQIETNIEPELKVVQKTMSIEPETKEE